MTQINPFDCAKRGDVDFFKTVAPEIFLNARDEYGVTVLLVAAKEGHLDCCEVIVERCTQLLYNDLMVVVDSRQRTALHYAVEQGNLDMVKLMCKAGLDKQLLSMPDEEGNTPLHLAVRDCNLEIARLLIEGYMIIDYCANDSNQTPLLMAMDKAAARDGFSSDSLVICKLLLEKDPSQCSKLKGDKGWTPLHYAISYELNSIVITIIHLAASYGLNSVVKEIIRLCPECTNTVDSHGQNVLHLATYHGHRDVVQQFLESKDTYVVALLNTQDKDGNTPLHLAISKLASDGSASDRKTICMLLLEKDPSQCAKLKGKNGWTLSHYAISYKLNSVAKEIIRLCPDCINTQDDDGNTPLHLAVRDCNLEIVRLLIEGDMVIDYCANNSNQIPLLMAMDKAVARVGSGLVICKLLLEKDPIQCTKPTGDKGWTLLHYAISNEVSSIAKDIIRLCPDCINTQDEDGNTPLHLAVSKGNVEVVRLLLEAHQISVHIANISKQTPYMMAMGKILSDGYGECSKLESEMGQIQLSEKYFDDVGLPQVSKFTSMSESSPSVAEP